MSDILTYEVLVCKYPACIIYSNFTAFESEKPPGQCCPGDNKKFQFILIELLLRSRSFEFSRRQQQSHTGGMN